MSLHVKKESKIALLLVTLLLGFAQPTYSMKRKKPDLETQEATHEVQDCKRQKTIRPILYLPTELLACIASYLPWKDINNTAMTCKNLYNRFVDHRKIISVKGDLDQIPHYIQTIESQPRLNSNKMTVSVHYESQDIPETEDLEENDQPMERIDTQRFFTFLTEDKKRAAKILTLNVPWLASNIGTELTSEEFTAGEISNLRNLRTLNLRGSFVLEEDIQKFLLCPLLKEICLGDIGLENLPQEIATSNVEVLKLWENFLTQDAFKIIFQSKELKKLNIDQNELEELPEEITQLTNLTNLSLYGNLLPKKVIKTICSCISLEKLNLGYNGLKRIPDEISRLTNLKTLNLSENSLTQKVIKTIGSCTSLENLDLSDCWLKRLPTEMTQLTNLKTLDLRGENDFSQSSKDAIRSMLPRVSITF